MKRKAKAKGRSAERAAFWRTHIAAWTASGKTAAVYAKQHGLAVQSLYQAKHNLRRASVAMPARSPRFARVEVADPRLESSVGGFRIRLARGAVLEWWPAPPASEIAALLQLWDPQP